MIVRCPLCEDPSYSVLYQKIQGYDGASVARCSHCTHIYTRMDHEPDYERLYNEGVYKIDTPQKNIFDKILTLEYKKILRRINSIKTKKGQLLDFGCGKGKFAWFVKSDGWQVKGVETAKARAEYTKEKYGIEVRTEAYSSGKIFEEDFDVITLFHVLEHLPNPKILLYELIKHNITKDGLAIIEVPNFKSLQSRIAGSKWMHLDIPRHISHFTSEKLDEMGQELNLKNVKTSYFSFHLGVLGMVDSFLKLFGYKKNIIHELKNKRGTFLLITVSVLLPFAFLMELFAAAIGRGGVVRKYFVIPINSLV